MKTELDYLTEHAAKQALQHMDDITSLLERYLAEHRNKRAQLAGDLEAGDFDGASHTLRYAASNLVCNLNGNLRVDMLMGDAAELAVVHYRQSNKQ